MIFSTKKTRQHLPVVFSGTVRHGDGYGRVLGYPTVNIDHTEYVQSCPDLPRGVYAGYVTLSDGRRLKAGIVIGSEGIHGFPKIEAHLIDFSGELYGQHIAFEVVKFLRAYRRFEHVDDLVQQIGEDIEKVRRILN